MKRWQREQPAPVPEVPYNPVLSEQLKESSPIPSMPWLECIGCKGKAVVLFEGTSFCRPCLKHEITTGQKRRHYE